MNNIFKWEDDIRVYVPVHFNRIINNIQHQLNIQSDSMVNITPFELYEKIEETIEKLNSYSYSKPTELFKLMLIYYLSPKEILMVRRFNKKAVNILSQMIIANYKKSIVQ